jgi:ATP-dependent exoDNAse (exonuclease V) beta subunit
VPPSLTEPSEENLLAVKEAVLDTPSSAIIVSDEEKKNEFMTKFPEIADRVFTVFDAKGLEFYNVFVCNLLTAHKKEWAEIYRRNVRRNTKYRFYFNAFYVATTRATEHLVLLEANFPKNLMRKISAYVEASERFDEEAVLVDSNTNRASDWLREGQRLETHGDFTRAIAAYKRSGAEPENAWRVEAKLAEERREWVEATKGDIKAGDFDSALRVAKLSGEGEWERFARMLSDLSAGREADIVDIDFYKHAKDNFGDDAGAAILIVSKLLTGSIIGKE